MDESGSPLIPTWYDFVWSGATIVFVVLAIIALVQVARSGRDLDGMTRLIWAVAILLLPVIGAGLWFYYRATTLKPRRLRVHPGD